MKATPSTAEREARIRELAYLHYERNGRRPGRALDDWLAAEAELDAGDRPAHRAAKGHSAKRGSASSEANA